MSNSAESASTSDGELRPFNLSGLDDEEIAFLGRALFVGDRYDLDNDELSDGLMRQGLIERFTVEMGRFIDTEPDRAKALLKRAALSDVEYDGSMAVWCTEELARRDFPLARDILVYRTDLNATFWKMDDIGRWATPEQRADLDDAYRVAVEDPEAIPPGLQP